MCSSAPFVKKKVTIRTPELKKIIATRIDTLMSRDGTTQLDVQRSTGINRTSMSRYQNGTRMASALVVAALAKYFNVSADFLLGLDGTQPSYSVPSWVVSTANIILSSGDPALEQTLRLTLESLAKTAEATQKDGRNENKRRGYGHSS